jgi:hypothetical protein
MPTSLADLGFVSPCIIIYSNKSSSRLWFTVGNMVVAVLLVVVGPVGPTTNNNTATTTFQR